MTDRVRRRAELLVALAAMAIAALVVAPQVVAHDGDPSVFLRVGRYAAARSFVEADLPDPVLTGDYGHDGQQFYVIARTFPHLTDAQGHVDNLRYRARRIVFPVVVSPFPAGAATVWAMVAVNLLAVGAAAIAIARLGRRVGAPVWVGLVAGLTPALLESVAGGLGDALAFALALWGVVLWRRRTAWAVVLFTVAALTRETTLVVPLACLVVGSGRRRWAMLAPFGVYLAWMAVVAAWLPARPDGSGSIVADVTAQLTWPFKGWVDVGLTQPGPVAAVLLLAASVLAAWQLRHRLPELSVWLLADVALLVTAGVGVTERPLNIARVAPLALPAVALAFFDARSARTVEGDGSGVVEVAEQAPS